MLGFFAMAGSIKIRKWPYFFYSIYLLFGVFYFFNYHHFVFSDFFTQDISGYPLWKLNSLVLFNFASAAYLMYMIGIIKEREKVSDFRLELIYALAFLEFAHNLIICYFFFVSQDISMGFIIKRSFSWIALLCLPIIFIKHLWASDKLIVLVLFGGGLIFIGATCNGMLKPYMTAGWWIQPIDIFQICVIIELLCFVTGVGLAIDQHQSKNIQNREFLITELETKDIQSVQLRNELESVVRIQSGKIEKETAKKLQAQYKEKITELEMRALRSQMNPHFLFHSLNSLKKMVLGDKHSDAQEYIDKFAVLLRTILNNSREKAIDLQSEIDFIELYLELENMRFKEQFEFCISSEPEVDTENVSVPPMLLQPYVENALWHGLMNKKEGRRRLEIEISNKGEEILVSIRDNGVGRQMGTKIRNAEKSDAKTAGVRVTAERMELIKSMQNKNDVSAKIVDLYDRDENPIGTEVIVSLAK